MSKITILKHIGSISVEHKSRTIKLLNMNHISVASSFRPKFTFACRVFGGGRWTSTGRAWSEQSPSQMEPTKMCIVRFARKQLTSLVADSLPGRLYCKLNQVFLSVLFGLKDLLYYKRHRGGDEKTRLCNSILMHSTLLLGWSQCLLQLNWT